MARIVLSGVDLRYGDREVLRGIDTVLTERRIGVVGGNGSGKSTLARLLNGLVLPTHGTVSVDGLDTAKSGAAVRRKVGFVFTDPDAQIVMPTVIEDVAFSLRRSGLPPAERAVRVAAALDRFGLGGHADHPCHLLSGGQKQLLALTSVLVAEPEVLVCDEPTTLLDARNARRVASLVADLPQQVIMVTHHLQQLESFDRVLVVDGGTIVADAAPREALPAYLQLIG
jgi:biotin transport system ATP-binding protein